MFKWVSIRLILYYRAHAPASIRNRCRYTPSCSAYTLIAIRRFGFFEGWRLGLNGLVDQIQSRILAPQPAGRA
ncbi:membrane protein insertion efficiency factor YidD [Salmonella enterica]